MLDTSSTFGAGMGSEKTMGRLDAMDLNCGGLKVRIKREKAAIGHKENEVRVRKPVNS